MNKEINNNLLIVMTLGALVFNGCVSKSIMITDNEYKEDLKVAKVKPFSWNKIKTSSHLPIEKKLITSMSGFKNKLSSNFQNPQMGNTAFGKASVYGEKLAGKRTASGDIFNGNEKTVAHKSLPFNTMLRVTNLRNNRSEVVRVNDRGAFEKSKILNVSQSTAESLGMLKNSFANVKVEILGFDGVVVNQLHSTNEKLKDCKDCYVTVPPKNSRIISVSKQIKSVYTYKSDKNVMSKSTYEYDEDPNENIYRVAEIIDSSPSIESFLEKTAIQIGAFRQHAGAKVYAKKYALLSSQYNVEIKENIKDDRPLYRVRIEGFSNDFEAKEFIARYALTGAFLVRK